MIILRANFQQLKWGEVMYEIQFRTSLIITGFLSYILLHGSTTVIAAAGSVSGNSSVHISSVRAGNNSIIKVGSVDMQSFSINGHTAINTQTVSGSINADRSSTVHVAYAGIHNTSIGGDVDLSLNVKSGDIQAGRDSAVGVGTLSIDAQSSVFNKGARLYGYNSSSVENPLDVTAGLEDIYTATPENTEFLSDMDHFEVNGIYEDYQYAHLSRCSYLEKDCTLPPKWKSLTHDDLRKLDLDPNLFRDDNSGFHAKLFYNENTGEYVLGFEGTSKIYNIRDWWNGNFPQALGIAPVQYDLAVQLALSVDDNKKIDSEKLSFTGHSLGGGLATMASMVTGREAVTFNSSGLRKTSLLNNLALERSHIVGTKNGKFHFEIEGLKETINGLNTIDNNWDSRNDLITAYFVQGDELTDIQESSLLLKDAIGTQVELPNPGGIDLDTEHDIDVVIQSLDAEIEKRGFQSPKIYAKTDGGKVIESLK